MKHMKFIALITILIVLSSCESSNEPIAEIDYILPSGTYLVPLDSGNTWVYRHYISDFENPSAYWLDTGVVLGDSVLDGQTWQKVDFPSTYLGGLHRNERAGFYAWNGYPVRYFSLIRGDSSYFETTGVDGISGWYFKLASTETVVNVPAGTFTTLEFHVMIDGNGVTASKYYFAPGVGLVQLEGYSWALGVQRYLLQLDHASIQ